MSSELKVKLFGLRSTSITQGHTGTSVGFREGMQFLRAIAIACFIELYNADELAKEGMDQISE